MFKNLYLLLTILFGNLCISQNVNLILQVNGKVLNGEISNLYLQFSKEKNAQKFPVNYYPGDLIFDGKIWEMINSNPKFYLHFDYNTFKNASHDIANFDIELTQKIIEQPYLIVDVFDFRNKKYKHWYQWLTKENYIAELIYPGSGIYIRKK